MGEADPRAEGLISRFRSLAKGLPVLVYAVPMRDGFEFWIVLFRGVDVDRTEAIYNTLTEEFPKADINFLYFTPEDWEYVRLPEKAVKVVGRELQCPSA